MMWKDQDSRVTSSFYRFFGMRKKQRLVKPGASMKMNL